MAGVPQNVQSIEAALQEASGHVDIFLNKDKGFPALEDLISAARTGPATMSGTTDNDFPSLAAPSIGLADLPLLGPTKKTPLPPELVEQFGHMQCYCMMGAFPEISRAWLSIDTDIFVWNYQDGGDLAYFDGLSETILYAGLVRPKPNIFRPHIRFLMCIATTVEIVLLGVSFTRPREDIDSDDFAQSEMHLIPEPLFAIPSDNSHITNIHGTKDGRIFMASKDGCLYELVYQAQDGWFSRKCRKVNHSSGVLSYLIPSMLQFSDKDPLVQIALDESRHILYTRSEQGTLSVYDMGSDGKDMKRITSIYYSSILRETIAAAKTIDRSHFKQLVHIAAVTSHESSYIHLVGVTHSGIRLYFSTTRGQYGDVSKQRPSTLSLVHVRLPPGFTANMSSVRPSNVHVAYYSKGCLMLCASQNEDSDRLWCLSHDAMPFQQTLMETQVSHQVDSRTWFICEIPSEDRITRREVPSISLSPSKFRPMSSPSSPSSSIPDPPTVVQQHALPAPRYVLLSSQGSIIISRLRPVDQLRQLMLNNMGPKCPAVENFFKLHKEDQACATCLILACSTASSDQTIADWATQAFFLHGGEPGGIMMDQQPSPVANLAAVFGATTPVVGQSGHDTTTRPFGSPVGATPGSMHPTVSSTPFHQSTPANQPPASTLPRYAQLSGKFQGLCLYFSRIVRPMWDNRLVKEIPVIGHHPVKILMSFNVASHELSSVLGDMKALKNFLEKNSQYTMMAENLAMNMPASNSMMRGDPLTSGGPALQREHLRLRAEAYANERQALVNLQKLVNMTVEVLDMLKLLCYHQFHIVAATLSQIDQEELKKMTFRDLVLRGKEMCGSLITAVINRYIGDNSTTDAISTRLREVCPSLYSTNDAICTKANETLQAAKTAETKSVGDRLLRESLELFKKVSQQLNLSAVCAEYHEAHYYDGVVDLCLSAAVKRDPHNLALIFYKNGKQPEDAQGMEAFSARYECYKSITDILDQLLTASQAQPSSPGLPNRPGAPPKPDPNRLSTSDAEHYLDGMMHRCLDSDDELFHVTLYDWLVNKGLKEQLLEISSPFVEPYIKRAVHYNPDSLEMLDLLWKYHEKCKNYPAASRILCKLAERHSTDVKLQHRIEYLSRAVMCSKSSSLRTSSASEGEFLHEIEEKLEVARLQLQVFEAISQSCDHTDQHVQSALSILNSELVDITRLYGDFASEFGLSKCKLAIVHCAGHYEEDLIQDLWQEIVDKELHDSADKLGATRMTILSKLLISLGKLYSNSERYFPLDFLVLYLEKKSCELEWNESWVFKAMLDVGVPLPKLHSVYDRHFRAKDPFWHTSRNPQHMLRVIASLLSTFSDNAALVPVHDRRLFINSTLDAIASYKVELEATPGRPHVIQSYLDSFTDLQNRLDRMQINRPR
ncbi:nuclear pore complex protein Nup155-like [Lytechinus pictus]|uniref:nuclear pore complex protein Nup155-like n=1 Tax=Lytechinus pictus TaxID=7653 RepID=UPI0030B9DBEE